MSAPAPSRRRHGVLLLWCGGVAMVLASAFGFAWWKLPEWQPEWVVRHSPWIEPVVRAMVGTQDGEMNDAYEDALLMDRAPAIGRELRRMFAQGEPWQRERVMILAQYLLTRQPSGATLADPTRFFKLRTDGSSLTAAEATVLWDDIVWLIEEASTDHRARLRELTTDLITVVPKSRWMPRLCGWATEEQDAVQLHRLLYAIGRGRDPHSVPPMLSLFTEERQEHDVGIADALTRCLASTQVAEVSLAAHHPRWQVRAWAASVIHRVMADDALRQRFVMLLEDPAPHVRLSAVKAIIEQDIPETLRAAFLMRFDDPESWVRQEVRHAILDRGFPPELRSGFITRLPGPDQELQRVIIDAAREDLIGKGFEPLLRFLGEQPEWSLRWQVIVEMGVIDRGRIAPIVRRIAKEGDGRSRGPAIVMLGTFSMREDVPALFALLGDADPEIARSAYTALGDMSLINAEWKRRKEMWDARMEVDPAPPASPIPSRP